MKDKKFYLIKTFLAACVLLTGSCSAASTANVLPAETILVGSTPGDALIKSLLAINPESRIDFIRWNLTLNHSEDDSKNYVLNITFGEGQPNTNGFKGGGEKISLEGIYTISKNGKSEIYELKNEKAHSAIRLIKLNENLFHFLTPEDKLMVGGGGWSYTLSRKNRSAKNSPLSFPITSLTDETAEQAVFGGRTPCLDFAVRYNLRVGNDCHKLKWKLILSRDSKTNQPTVYTLKTTLNRPHTAEGKWRIIKGVKNNAEATIYQLDPDKPDKSISLLVGDENVLFFLDREFRLLTGNEDFSFTLNRSKN